MFLVSFIPNPIFFHKVLISRIMVLWFVGYLKNVSTANSEGLLYCLLGCDKGQSVRHVATFERNLLPPSSTLIFKAAGSSKMLYSSPPLSAGDTFQDLPRIVANPIYKSAE
jgi:hypothetical protein